VWAYSWWTTDLTQALCCSRDCSMTSYFDSMLKFHSVTLSRWPGSARINNGHDRPPHSPDTRLDINPPWRDVCSDVVSGVTLVSTTRLYRCNEERCHIRPRATVMSTVWHNTQAALYFHSITPNMLLTMKTEGQHAYRLPGTHSYRTSRYVLKSLGQGLRRSSSGSGISTLHVLLPEHRISMWLSTLA